VISLIAGVDGVVATAGDVTARWILGGIVGNKQPILRFGEDLAGPARRAVRQWERIDNDFTNRVELLRRNVLAVAVGRHFVAIILFRERHQIEDPTSWLILTESTIGVADPPKTPSARRKVTDRLMVVDRGQGKLLEIIGTLLPARRLARRLDRGQ